MKFVYGLDADGVPFGIGDEMVWSNPNGEDPDERFTVLGCVTEGGIDGDLFIIDTDRNEHFAGWCRKVGACRDYAPRHVVVCMECRYYAPFSGVCECQGAPTDGEWVRDPNSYYCSLGEPKRRK